MNAPAGRADAGTQPERTRLAWQRTTVSIAVCALIVARFMALHNVALGVGLAAGSLVCAAMVGISASRRGGRATTAFDSPIGTLPDARGLAWVTALVVLTGIAAIVLVLS